ncbi:protein phosphatase regulatory subunit Reg1 [Schizosaccharomyces japonicus yFS275]|uniref:Protein phosphatase regulatory subunit Reg1 n=1 Tax=Schizosaccharomyces japonicus (strain yFS275 / FY16936) TaxID=402676 RepID=B6JVW8_SCHJY|nr:protein phosphatase regulatory subunit Reg1 [Schizosaccharomyces japonicus yFS275]EEB05519.1 protein phosphatase regulatory subunit Reg1 [Schizosaccharomyces japonicus yFS275]
MPQSSSSSNNHESVPNPPSTHPTRPPLRRRVSEPSKNSLVWHSFYDDAQKLLDQTDNNSASVISEANPGPASDATKTSETKENDDTTKSLSAPESNERGLPPVLGSAAAAATTSSSSSTSTSTSSSSSLSITTTNAPGPHELSHVGTNCTVRRPVFVGADDCELKNATMYTRVDYLSYDWKEDDIWASWREVTRIKNDYENGIRLENASWRTWAKAKNHLKTISPETLNWLKECDVTWLYGPLLHSSLSHPDSLDHVVSSSSRTHAADVPHETASVGANSRIPPLVPGSPGRRSKSKDCMSPHRTMKPILKHRSASELLLTGRNLGFRLSPKSEFSRYQLPSPSLPFARMDSSSAKDSANNDSASSSTTSKNTRRIHFNDCVQQCIAVDYADTDAITTEDDDGGDGDSDATRTSSSQEYHDTALAPPSSSSPPPSSSSHSRHRPIIEKLPDSTLKGVREPEPYGHLSASVLWAKNGAKPYGYAARSRYNAGRVDADGDRFDSEEYIEEEPKQDMYAELSGYDDDDDYAPPPGTYSRRTFPVAVQPRNYYDDHYSSSFDESPVNNFEHYDEDEEDEDYDDDDDDNQFSDSDEENVFVEDVGVGQATKVRTPIREYVQDSPRIAAPVAVPAAAAAAADTTTTAAAQTAPSKSNTAPISSASSSSPETSAYSSAPVSPTPKETVVAAGSVSDSDLACELPLTDSEQQIQRPSRTTSPSGVHPYPAGVSPVMSTTATTLQSVSSYDNRSNIESASTASEDGPSLRHTRNLSASISGCLSASSPDITLPNRSSSVSEPPASPPSNTETDLSSTKTAAEDQYQSDGWFSRLFKSTLRTLSG